MTTTTAFAETNSIIFEYERELTGTPTKPTSIYARTSKLLRTLGVRIHMRGYAYIVYAAELLINDPSYNECVTKRLYPEVAKKFNTTWNCVERGIRHAVQSMSCSDDVRKSVFGFVDDTYPNRQFLSTIVEILKIQDMG